MDYDVLTANCCSSQGDGVDRVLGNTVTVGDWCISISAVAVND